jgi:peptidoglycan hydrolase-like protein with peptidoglycan-binding domain
MYGRIGSALFAVALAWPASAAERALVIGNENYTGLADVSRGGEVVAASEALRGAGVEVVTLRDGGIVEMLDALEKFVARAEDADRLLVVLSGAFATTGGETYLLPVRTQIPAIHAVARYSLPVSLITTILEAHDDRSVLILSHDGRSGEAGPYLDLGLGDVDTSSQVIVVRARPEAAAQMVRDVLAEPDADLAAGLARIGGAKADRGIPRNWSFLEAGSGRPGDDALWRRARDAETEAAIEQYLARFPNGRHALEARLRLEEMRRDPVVQAQRQEAALDLTREQRQQIQRGLSLLGYETRGIDGIFGRGSRSAISAWQRDNDLAQTAYLTGNQIDLIARQAVARRQEMEQEADQRRARTSLEDRLFWKSTGGLGTEAGYREYLDRYPDGRFAEIAQNRLGRFQEERGREADAFERDIWDEARDEDTIATYRRYLDRFPQGAFAGDARRNITRLEQARDPEIEAARQQEAELGLNPMTSRLVEERLTALGLKPGSPDGTFDDRTRRAIRRYQAERGLNSTGYLNEGTVVRLLADSVQQLLR